MERAQHPTPPEGHGGGGGTRSALWLPLFDELADPVTVARVAAEAEEAGWHGVFVWDQLRWPAPVIQVADPHYTIDGIQFLPRPVQRPGVPVWVAGFPGNVKPLRRAARYDGFFPANLDHPDQLAEVAAAIADLRRDATAPYDIAVGLPIGVDPAPYAKAGATWWLPEFAPETVSLDAVRGVLRDGPMALRP